MTTIINASTTNNLQLSGDGSGVIKVQSNGVTTNALAWVSFVPGSTPTIRSSYNVASLTRVSTGIYTVNFTNSTTDANYSALVSGAGTSSNASSSFGIYTTSSGASSSPTTSSFTFTCLNGSSYTDLSYVNVAVFGN